MSSKVKTVSNTDEDGALLKALEASLDRLAAQKAGEPVPEAEAKAEVPEAEAKAEVVPVQGERGKRQEKVLEAALEWEVAHAPITPDNLDEALQALLSESLATPAWTKRLTKAFARAGGASLYAQASVRSREEFRRAVMPSLSVKS
jgi:hypothetical protein